jgi:hypothetical protein
MWNARTLAGFENLRGTVRIPNSEFLITVHLPTTVWSSRSAPGGLFRYFDGLSTT